MRFSCLLALLCLSSFSFASLILAREYEGQEVIGWAMSEKLDGVRAYWDGKDLRSRNGYIFSVPEGFLKDFPNFHLDGELFLARGSFEALSGMVRRYQGDWQGVYLYVFDVPQAEGDLFQRLEKAKAHLRLFPDVRFKVIEQHVVKDWQMVADFLDEVERLGGEGVMLRDPNLPYQAGRSAGLLKLKSVYDDECVVVAHHTGKGKYQDKMGALTCENEKGRFRIGTGFSDEVRANPPPIGSIITYRYRGWTNSGLPRFPSYWRMRNEAVEDY